MPPRPADRSKGFAEGASKKWFDFVYGNTQEQVLPRLLGKCQDSSLIRPNKSDYSSSFSLSTDQAVLDSLP